MIEIPPDAVKHTLVAFERRWLKLIAADRWQEACGMIDEPNCYDITWTPKKIRNVVEDTFPPAVSFAPSILRVFAGAILTNSVTEAVRKFTPTMTEVVMSSTMTFH